MPMHGVTELQQSPTKRQAARIDFLMAYLGLPTLPGTNEDVNEAGRAALDQVVARMKHAGLYGRTSEDADCRWGVRVLVTALRRAMR